MRPYTWIFDAMAVLQAVTKIPDTFDDLSGVILQALFIAAPGATRIDFVADQYNPLSIKSAE